jgi:hypothetical protein
MFKVDEEMLTNVSIGSIISGTDEGDAVVAIKIDEWRWSVSGARTRVKTENLELYGQYWKLVRDGE